MLEQVSGWLGGIPVPAVIVLLGLGIIQLALQIHALIDLARQEAVLGDRKWIWLIVILLGNLVGAIVYLAVGRGGQAAADPAGGFKGKASAEGALDLLYGDEEKR